MPQSCLGHVYSSTPTHVRSFDPSHRLPAMPAARVALRQLCVRLECVSVGDGENVPPVWDAFECVGPSVSEVNS